MQSKSMENCLIIDVSQTTTSEITFSTTPFDPHGCCGQEAASIFVGVFLVVAKTVKYIDFVVSF
jgi:hypothetical protein